MTEETDIATAVEQLRIELSATRAILIATLAVVANADPAMLRSILDSLPKPAPEGATPLGTPLNQFLEAVAIEADSFLDNLRDALSAE